jgi:glucosamine 6-phosphate synthetase-like amidotransferase/phosphosugar isomerase protein
VHAASLNGGQGGLQRARSTARVSELMDQVQVDHIEGGTGIAHTRWATHGAPAVHNAHPHFSHGKGDASQPGRVALVHNGIIENHDALRAALQAKGYVFSSQTDTEVIAHLVDSLYKGDVFEAVKAAVLQLHGAYAIAVFHKDEPHRVVGARAGSPLILGVGQGETFLASDAMALAEGSTLPEVAQDRALSEATAFAIRIDVAEEITRLNSHLDELERLIKKGGEIGKRLDFLIQELHREANTMGSKSAALALTHISVDMKVLIEQMREQVQNIE